MSVAKVVEALEQGLGEGWVQTTPVRTDDAIAFRHPATGTILEVEITRPRDVDGSRPHYRGFSIHTIASRPDIPWADSQVDPARFSGKGWQWRLALDASKAAKAEVEAALIQLGQKSDGR